MPRLERLPLPEAIRRIQEHNGNMTITALAEMIGTSRMNVSRWRSGQERPRPGPPLRLLLQLARQAGVEVTEESYVTPVHRGRTKRKE